MESLGIADRVVIAEVFQSGNIPESERLEPEVVAAGLRVRGTPARMCRADAKAIVARLWFRSLSLGM